MEQFEKVRSLGRGAQGSVILVKRKSDQSLFVIKKIFMEEHSGKDSEAIMSEIKILATLAHPNIVSYFGSFMQNKDLNVVMEYADGGTLFNRIASAKEPFPEDKLMHIFTQLAKCLEHLHEKKVLHRDLKTKNIFMTQDDVIKLGDFGLSKVLGSQHSFANSAVGTPYYLSPELCEGKPYDYKGDIWALGCVAYEMTTLKHAFHATNLPALVMTIVQAKYKPVPEEYSAELRTIIHSCLEKDPDHRPDISQIINNIYVQKWMKILKERQDAEGVSGGGSIGGGAGEQERPFFSAGAVETVVEKNKSTLDASTDAVMREVQEEAQFLRLLLKMRADIGVQDRTKDRVPYFQCFMGKDLINFICRELGIRSRDEASRAAQKWMLAGVFYHVNRTEPFLDSQDLYRFMSDEVNIVLNVKEVCGGEVRDAVLIEEDLRRQLSKLVSISAEQGTSLINYTVLKNSAEFSAFSRLSLELQQMDLRTVSFNVKIALFINIYNALVIHGYLVIGPPKDLYQRIHFYNHTAYNVGGLTYSLNDIEHGIMRGNQKPPNSYCRVFRTGDKRLQAAVVVWDPRIHFALIRGTKSCPRLQVFDPEQLDEQLNSAAVDFCSQEVEVTFLGDQEEPDFSQLSIGALKEHLQKMEINYSTFTEKSEFREACRATIVRANNGQMARREVILPAVFELYKDDFGSTDADLLFWVKPFLPAEKQDDIQRALDKDDWIVKFKPFDMAVNKSSDAPGSPKANPAMPHSPMSPPAMPTGVAARPRRGSSLPDDRQKLGGVGRNSTYT